MITVLERKKETGKVQELKTLKKGAWIDVENPSQEDVFFIEKNLKIPRDVVLDCLDEDEVPRVESKKNYTLVIVRVPIRKKEGFETIPLGIIFLKNFIVTIHKDSLDFLQEFYEGEITFSTYKKVRFLFQILRRIILRYTRILRELEKDLRKTEKEFIQHAKNEYLLYLMEMKEHVLDIQNAIHENNKVLEAILTGHYIKLYKEDTHIITDIIIDNRQCMTMASFLIKNLNNALQTFEWIISNNLNILMKKLTSLAMILSIPVLVSGIYGMNITLPLQNDPNAFLILITVSFVISVLVAAFFKWKEWI